MTKTLTEQWREGTLPYTYYYVKHTFGWKPFGINIDFWHGPFDKWGYLPEQYIKEVLAPVPSYDEWKQAKENLDKNGTWYTERSYKLLEKKLEIATKALKRIDPPNIIFDDYRNSGIDLWEIAHNALKEMEGVK